MSVFRNYSDTELVDALKNLRGTARMNDFPVIEELEKTLTLRGHDVTKPEYGKDVVAEYLKTLPGVIKRRKIRVVGGKR